MSVRTLIELSVTAGFGASIDDSIFERDFAQLDDTLEEAKAVTRTLPASGTPTDIEVPFEGISDVRFVYVEADGEIEVKLFGTGGSAIPLARPIDPAASSAGEKRAIFAAHIRPATLHLRNPSATNDVNVRVLLVGDLVT